MRSYFFRITFVLLLLTTARSGFSQGLQERVVAVPNPRVQGGWVSDPQGVASKRVGDINRILSDLERKTGAEVGVAIVPTIGNLVPKDFAVALFKAWGVGKKGKDNGVLVLQVLDQRRVEIEVGYGLESVLPDAECNRIISYIAIPFFKTSNFSDGHYEIARAIATRIADPNTPAVSASYQTETTPGQNSDAPATNAPPNPGPAPTRPTPVSSSPASTESPRKFMAVAAVSVLMAAMAFLLGPFLANRLSRSSPRRQYDLYQTLAFPFQYGGAVLLSLGMGALGGAIPGASGIAFILALAAGVLMVRYQRGRGLAAIRHAPRICSCGKRMQLLDAEHEVAYLAPGQIAEEKLGSVDYDIWHCDCERTHSESYSGSFHAIACERCGFKTYHVKSDLTVKQATTAEAGLRETTYVCANCSFAKTLSAIIPVIVVAASTYSSDSSSSSSFGSSSSDSGSFGGGSSGGGGAGGSY